MAGTTANYGFNYPTSTDLVKDGATAMQTLATNVDTTLFTALGGAYPGLRLVKKQTVGTGVTSVAVTSAFSATYDNYKIVYSGGVAAATGTITIQLTGATTNYFDCINGVAVSTGAGILAANNNVNNAFNWCGNSLTAGNYCNVEVSNPFLAQRTYITNILYDGAGGPNQFTHTGCNTNNTSYTGFSLINTNALTGGTIYVYGYGMS